MISGIKNLMNLIKRIGVNNFKAFLSNILKQHQI